MKKGKVNIRAIVILFSLIIPLLVGCQSEDNLDSLKLNTPGTELKLTFVIPATNVATRATAGYEDGINYENEINLSAYDYRLYFFTYNQAGDSDGGKLIAEFYPTSVTSSFQADETIYTVTGSVPDDLLERTDFRAVVLANWDNNYPSVTIGETTISELTSSTTSTFLAKDKFELDSSHLIPFYGVQEYSDITFNEGETTPLPDDVSLLRALAKVEVVLKDDNDLSFSKVILHNYNSQGYSAPKDIYLSSQYNHDNWDEDYVQTLHLVNDGKNDEDATEKSISFVKTQDREVNEATGEVTQYETWDLYIPEYDNTTNAETAAYIEVWFDYQMEDDEPYQIYFKEYDEEEGTLKDDGTTWDIYRNNLYRFNVSFGEYELQVNVQDWQNVFDNTWTFGDMSQVIAKDEDIEKDNIMYRVVTSEYDEDTDTYTLEVWIERGQSQYVGSSGQFNIPETVTYLGYTYTVVGINANCFDGDVDVVSIDIPATVTYIGDYAFEFCTSLECLYFHSNYPPECGEYLFAMDNDINLTIYVPLGMSDNYDKEPWNQFTIQETSY